MRNIRYAQELLPCYGVRGTRVDMWPWVEERERASGQGRDARQGRGGMLTLEPWVGNVKLLETITTCSQVLSSGGEPNGEIAG